MSRKRILIIDDESDIREIAKLSLTLTKQWDVLTASSGEEGGNIASEFQPDAILLDLIMPQLGGLDTLKLLKENKNTVGIPVVLLTATAKLAMKAEYTHWGARGILVKPFDPGTLGDQIEELLAWGY
ncbi:MAG: response regulator [Leptolyngbya sp. SIOISBB]|nr:response regulator [Leptolyngbya sp. SIOISBB]